MTIQLSYAAALLLAALAGCAAVKPQQPDAPVPQTHSVPEADGKLAQAARDRAQAEAQFAASEQQCYARFMVNNCLDKAREKRRAALAGVRAIEVEADRFRRQARVDEREREIAKAEAQFQAEQARMAAGPPRPAAPVAPAKPARVPHDRAAEQAARLQNLEAQEKAGAASRAAKVEAFEQRQRDSARRQKEIADKNKAAVSEDEGK
jgi:colicin import membrane protein